MVADHPVPVHSRSCGAEMVVGSGIPKPGMPGMVNCGGDSSVATPWASVGMTAPGGVGSVPAASAIGADGMMLGSPGEVAAAWAAGMPGTAPAAVAG